MNHKDDFDLHAGCEDKSACTADCDFRGDINDCT